MDGVTLKQRLTELQQIETLIQHDQSQYLRSTVLCQIPCVGDALPIYALSLGNHDPDIPNITYVAGIHGLERIGTQVVLAFLEGLLERLKWDVVLSEILQRVRINVLPLMNPVGMFNGTRANGQGIDLMRNAPINSSEKRLCSPVDTEYRQCYRGIVAKPQIPCNRKHKLYAALWNSMC